MIDKLVLTPQERTVAYIKDLINQREELYDSLQSVLADTTSTFGHLESHKEAEVTLKWIEETR